jgi:hypothetical protein
MSTILKALRRLEEQKSGAAERPLRDEVVLAPRRANRRKGLVLAVAGAIAFALVGAALVALFDRVPGADDARLAGDVAASPDPAVGIAIAEERATQVIVAAPDPGLRGIEVPVVSASELEPDFEVVRPASKPRPFIPTMQVDPVPDYQPHTAVARPARLAPPPAEPEYIEEEVPTARDARSAAPVHVDRTQWHPSPERRVAWVEVEGATALREVREGERVGPYVVRTIEPAAVLFSEGSVQVRREVGR